MKRLKYFNGCIFATSCQVSMYPIIVFQCPQFEQQTPSRPSSPHIETSVFAFWPNKLVYTILDIIFHEERKLFYGATSLEMYCLLFFFWAVWSSSWYWSHLSRLDKVKSLVQLLGWKNKECVQFAVFSVCFLFPWISCSFWSSFHCSLSLLSFFCWNFWWVRDVGASR